MRNRRRSWVRSSAFVLLCACAVTAFAQAKYPSRPVRVVVPYTPGGITDVATRMVMQEVSKALAQNVIIDNRPGANSIIGVEIVAKAAPDGYTLASVIAAHAANQTLYPKLPYDSVKSFAPVSLLVTAPLIVCVTNSLPAKTAKELIELARAKPGQLTFASSGIGAAAHLTTELLMLTTGVKMVHVPYKGTQPALLDLTGGQVSLMMDTPGSMLARHGIGQAGRRRTRAADPRRIGHRCGRRDLGGCACARGDAARSGRIVEQGDANRGAQAGAARKVHHPRHRSCRNHARRIHAVPAR
jgi:tripartite-type tricarboxylate transporter receptor subunit TctC